MMDWQAVFVHVCSASTCVCIHKVVGGYWIQHVHSSFVCLIYLPGFTPLMYACESGDAQCVKLLLENGASINCVVSGNLY